MSKYITYFIIGILALAAYLFVVFTRESYRYIPPMSDEVGVQLEKYNFQDWHEFASARFGFKVLLPVLPIHASEVVNSQGQKRDYEMFVSQRNDNTVFMITLVKLQDKPTEKVARAFLSQMMQDMVKSKENMIIRSSEQGEYKDHQSLDYTLASDEMIIDTKSFVAGKTFYFLTRLTTPGSDNKSEFEFFINSFEITAE